KFMVKLIELLDRSDLLQYFSEDQYVARGTDEVYEALVETFATKDRDDWVRLLGDADIPVMPVNEGRAILDDPHISERIEWLRAVQGTVTMKPPVHSEPSLASPRPAPALGEDTEEILSSLVDAAELERLEKEGVIRVARPSEEA